MGVRVVIHEPKGKSMFLTLMLRIVIGKQTKLRKRDGEETRRYSYKKR